MIENPDPSRPLRVAAERCETCVFSKKSPIDALRMRELAEQWAGFNGHQTCHHFGLAETSGDSAPSLVGEDVACRGWYETQVPEELRTWGEALGLVEFVQEPGNSVFRAYYDMLGVSALDAGETS